MPLELSRLQTRRESWGPSIHNPAETQPLVPHKASLSHCAGRECDKLKLESAVPESRRGFLGCGACECDRSIGVLYIVLEELDVDLRMNRVCMLVGHCIKWPEVSLHFPSSITLFINLEHKHQSHSRTAYQRPANTLLPTRSNPAPNPPSIDSDNRAKQSRLRLSLPSPNAASPSSTRPVQSTACQRLTGGGDGRPTGSPASPRDRAAWPRLRPRLHAGLGDLTVGPGTCMLELVGEV